MSYFKEHSNKDADASRLKKIKYPPLSEYEDELKRGYSNRWIVDLYYLYKENQATKEDVRKAKSLIKKNPIPDKVDEGNWKILSRITKDAIRDCPLKSLKYVCSYRVNHFIRILYEVHEIDGKIKIIFTNCNYHIYRTRLYSVIVGKIYYRGDRFLDIDQY